MSKLKDKNGTPIVDSTIVTTDTDSHKYMVMYINEPIRDFKTTGWVLSCCQTGVIKPFKQSECSTFTVAQ